MLIGWFVMTAAGAEEQHAQLQHTLVQHTQDGIRVGDVMSADPVTVPGRLSVNDLVASYVWPHRFSSIPVTDETGRPMGLVTLLEIGGTTEGRILVLEAGRVVGIVSPTDIMRSLELADLRRPAERSDL